MRLPDLPALDSALHERIRAHVDDLTKPLGALGRLEELGAQLAWIAGTTRPGDPEAHILTFGGDHGIARHEVSAYPQEVTVQMMANIASGGAAISVLCRANRINHRLIDAGVAAPCPFPGVSQRNVVRGTRDPMAGPVMSRAEAEACIQAGMDEVGDLPDRGFALLGVGEMGIANSAVAALLVCAFTGMDPARAVGPGTGVRGAALGRKLDVIRRVLQLRRPDSADPVGTLAEVGGAEFGAMAGAMIAAAARGWAVIVDGYIAGAAALVALSLEPRLGDFLVWSHRSAEPGARLVLEHLGREPVLDLDLRLGEGTGAALAVPVLRSACALLREMATFGSAGVSREEGHA